MCNTSKPSAHRHVRALTDRLKRLQTCTHCYGHVPAVTSQNSVLRRGNHGLYALLQNTGNGRLTNPRTAAFVSFNTEHSQASHIYGFPAKWSKITLRFFLFPRTTVRKSVFPDKCIPDKRGFTVQLFKIHVLCSIFKKFT